MSAYIPDMKVVIPDAKAPYVPPRTYMRGNDMIDASTGQVVSLDARNRMNQAAMRTNPIIQGEIASQDAAVDTAEQQEVMKLNQQASANTNQLAMAQNGKRRQVGGGSFLNRGINANSAIAGLSTANAKAVATQKKKQIATEMSTPTGQLGALGNFASATKRALTGGG